MENQELIQRIEALLDDKKWISRVEGSNAKLALQAHFKALEDLHSQLDFPTSSFIQKIKNWLSSKS